METVLCIAAYVALLLMLMAMIAYLVDRAEADRDDWPK